MQLDPRLLRYLWVIEQNGTFTRAAEAEGISQPALTNKISLLERQLGTSLIDRGRHGARLNEFGTLLLRHARAIDAIADRAKDEVRTAVAGDSGPLILGGTPISMLELVPRALNFLENQNSRIRVSLIEADDDILLDKLRGGEIDLMLGGLLVGEGDDDIIETHLIDFPLEPVVGKSSPLWGREEISLDELLTQSWALPASGSVIRSYVDAIFVSAGASMPSNYWSCSSMHGLKSIIQHTSRVTLMPGHAFELEQQTGVLKGLTLRGPTSSRKLNILRLRHLPMSTVATTFVEEVIKIAKSIGQNF